MSSDGARPSQEDERIDIGTLGMFIIDRFEYRDAATDRDLGNQGWDEQIGGGGTYFAVGASMWLGPSKVLMIVDRGPDFPARMQEKLESFARTFQHSDRDSAHKHSLWRYRSRPDGTTRALNIYRGDERDFRYLTPKIRLDPIDLATETGSHFPRVIHFVCSPARAIEIHKQVDEYQDRWLDERRPVLVWEPIPDSARPENLNMALQACQGIDVLSPNHEEMAAFLSGRSRGDAGDIEKDAIESMGRDWLAKYRDIQLTAEQRTPIVCIRSGALGAFLVYERATHGERLGQGPQYRADWVPAWHTAEERDKIVDVTGAGNSWLGGFAAGLAMQTPESLGGLRNLDPDIIRKAAQLGSVTASYAIEQFGLPERRIDEGGNVLWNGDRPEQRLARLQAKE